MAIGRADHRAAVAMGYGHVALCPVPREHLDGARGNAAYILGPLRGFRDAVVTAFHMVDEPIEPDGVRLKVLLVVEALVYPNVGYGELQSRIGIGQHRNPFVGVDDSAVIRIGADIDLLDTDVGKKEAVATRKAPAPAPRRGLHIAAPEQHRLCMVRHIFEQVVLVALAHRVLAPHVLGAPVPAFPRIGVARLHGVAASLGAAGSDGPLTVTVHPEVVRQLDSGLLECYLVEQVALGTAGTVDGLDQMVPVRLHEDRVQAIRFLNAQHLGRDDIGRLVPADPFVLALAPVLRVALALRIPVHALHGIEDAVRRVNALLVRQGERREFRLLLGFELSATGLDAPWVQSVLALMRHVAERTRAQDASITHVDLRRIRRRARPAEPHRLERCLNVVWHMLLLDCVRCWSLARKK